MKEAEDIFASLVLISGIKFFNPISNKTLTFNKMPIDTKHTEIKAEEAAKMASAPITLKLIGAPGSGLEFVKSDTAQSVRETKYDGKTEEPAEREILPPCPYVFKKGANNGETCGKVPINSSWGGFCSSQHQTRSAQQDARAKRLDAVKASMNGKKDSEAPAAKGAAAKLPPPPTKAEVKAAQAEEAEKSVSNFFGVKAKKPSKEETEEESETEEEEPVKSIDNKLANIFDKDDESEESESEEESEKEKDKEDEKPQFDYKAQIRNYYIQLPYLKKELPEKLREGETDEEWARRLWNHHNTHQLTLLSAGMIETCVAAIENIIAPRLGIDLTGWSEVATDPNLLQAVKDYQMEQYELVAKHATPGKRILMILGYHAFKIGLSNHQKKKAIEASRNGVLTANGVEPFHPAPHIHKIVKASPPIPRPGKMDFKDPF